MAVPEPKPNPIVKWGINSLIVIGVFWAVDLVFHLLWPTPVPYLDSLPEKVLYTTLFSALYAHIYDKASQEFHISKIKVINGFVFSVLFCVIIFMAVGLMLWIGTTIYIYVLHGFHGAPPPPDLRQAGVFGTQVVAAGVALTGKTEDNPR